MPQPQLIIYSHTHWDRAWYAAFEVFRHKLVEHLDEVITHLEQHPEYLHYTLDGQTVVLEDYLEVRPEQRPRIAALVAGGRLEIGPWYVQPDCFIPSGEALIRNLLRGRAQALGFGAWMTVGYLPDSFGFPSQLPTILAGFGIDSMVFSRGMSAFADQGGCEFIWNGAGTASVLGLWMPQGYGNGCNLGYVTWWGDPRRQDFHVGHAVARLQDNITKQQRYSRTQVTVVPNGVDHSPIEAGVPAVVAMAQAETALAGYQVRHGTLRSYVDAVHASGAVLDAYRGEFRSTEKGVSLQGVHSARLYLKQQNQQAESLLERWAEPLTIWDRLFGSGRERRAVLRHAWKLLLLNHPHDDICGCSVDAVHRENETRSHSVIGVASALRREAAIALGEHIDFSGQPGIPLVVYNPHAFPVFEPLTLDFFVQKHEAVPSQLAVRDAGGGPVATAELGRTAHSEVWVRGIGFSRTRISLVVAVDLPPCGWSTYYIDPSRFGMPVISPSPAPLSTLTSLENEFYHLDFHHNGTFDVTVKATGHVYRNWHRFEDEADRGDEYDFCPAEDPGLVSSTHARSELRFSNTPLRAMVEIIVHLSLPKALLPRRSQRSGEITDVMLTTTVTLYSGSPRIECVTTGVNTARDHRLRVHFPTALAGSSHWVEEAFAVISRPDREQVSARAALPATPTAHQKSFLSLDDGEHGVTLMNRGLTEYEVLPDRSVALTLLRCVGFLSLSDLATRPGASGPELATDDAQCLRPFSCAYALIAHSGSWREAQTWRQAQLFSAPPWAFRGDEQLETDSRHFDDPALSARIVFTPPPRTGDLPDRLSLVQVDRAELVLSALKPAEQGEAMVVRFYSIATGLLSARVSFGRSVRTVHLADLAERPLRPLAVQGNQVGVEVAGGDLLTLLVHF